MTRIRQPFHCFACGRYTEADDSAPEPWHGRCWPCHVEWSVRFASRLSEHGQEALSMSTTLPEGGWYQVCERCGVRSFVLSDRPLCADCIRVPDRWKRSGLRSCGLCGASFRATGRATTYCDECSDPRAARIASARAIGRHTEVEWRELCEAYDFCCSYCGRRGVPLTKDHVIAVSKGGSDAIENIVPACLSCNSSKGAQDVRRWIKARARMAGG